MCLPSFFEIPSMPFQDIDKAKTSRTDERTDTVKTVYPPPPHTHTHTNGGYKNVLDFSLMGTSGRYENMLFGKEVFILFTASAFRKLPSVYVFSYFPFWF